MMATVKQTKRTPTGAAAMGAGPGRPMGSPNKATADARQAIARFIDTSAPRLLEWLGQVADGMPDHDIKPNPAKAIELVQALAEYHIPKLARTELAGDKDSPLRHVIAWEK